MQKDADMKDGKTPADGNIARIMSEITEMMPAPIRRGHNQFGNPRISA